MLTNERYRQNVNIKGQTTNQTDGRMNYIQYKKKSEHKKLRYVYIYIDRDIH